MSVEVKRKMSSISAVYMKKDASIKNKEKKIGWESTYIYNSERHFDILKCRNALRTDYVKRPRRSVIAETNRMENAE
jgi:hypothetical protein